MLPPDFVTSRTRVQAQICRDLLVPAAPAVQLVTDIADQI